MSNVTGNNYKQNATGNAGSVTLNAYVNCVCRQLLRCNVTACVKLRYVRFLNDVKHAENGGFMTKNIVFCKMKMTGMTGIVKIPSSKVRSFDIVEAMLKLAHHFLPTLKNVDYVQNSGTELNTFNPFVVGSTPARPTRFLI